MATLTAAADGSHMSGAMIALMPTPEDAARLAIEGGEPAEQLHLTLYFLGDDGAAWTEDQRNELIGNIRAIAGSQFTGPVTARVFGANHWNANTDSPSWVWAVGDDRDADGPGLEDVHREVTYALEDTHERPEIPTQHSPWQPHICAAYSDELDLIIALEERLGDVTFDRVRVAFAGDHTDIPLTEAVTAAAGPLRRQPTELELASRADFAQMDKAWREAVDGTVEAWATVQEAMRAEVTASIQAAAEADDLDRLDGLTVDTDDGARLLIARMIAYAREAGEQQQAEAEAQGVTVPEWSLDDEALTAAAIRDRLRQIGRTAARVLGVGLVQSAVRQAMRVWGSGPPSQVAAQVDEHLAALSGAAVEEQVGAAMSAAQNEGRFAVLAVTPPAEYTATEILDRNSCAPCREIDGTRYTTLPDARTAYPSGGYTGCLGGSRCRGTLVTVWPQDSEQAAAGMILAASAATMPPHQTTDLEGTMPYRVEQDHPDCGADTPWAVVKEDDAELMGCHATEAAAMEQQAALYAEDGDDEMDMPDGKDMDYAGKTAPWRGPLAIEGQVTGDGREFAADALTWAELPVPLRWNKEDSHGGEARTIAVNVGRIDNIWRDGSLIMGEGVLDLSDDDGRRVHAKIEGKFLRGVSIDADSIADADVEFVWPEDVNAGTGEAEEGDLLEMLFAQPEKMIFHGGRIRAATLVDIPAFAEAYIALLDDAGAVVAGGQPIGEAVLQTAAQSAAVGTRTKTARRSVTAGAPASHPAMTGLWKPPAAWFSDPDLPFYCGIVVTDQGRLYGHAAPWGACHIGFDGECVTVPRESEHSHYMTGETVCDDGSRVAVGQITVGTGHAPLHFGAQPAADHYDNTGTAVADVAVGNDKHGIWVAGAIRPNADPLSVYELRASGRVSGDWRRIGGQLRMVGLLGVNVAGFLEEAKMRTLVSAGQPQALVAAGVPKQQWAMSKDDVERQAVRIVMRMLSRRVHPGGR
jgi:2'-5' RNA ligase